MSLRTILGGAFAGLCLHFAAVAWAAQPPAGGISNSTADHHSFKVLQQDFDSGPAVTRACLGCHTEAAKQIQQTEHWKWEYVNPDTHQVLGKRHVVNDFCTSVTSNMEHCAECHIGYNHNHDKYDFAAAENVDCLVCHDTTGRYKKAPEQGGNVFAKDTEFPPGSGKIVKGLDLKLIAQSVGKTSRITCGACHFSGGGGDGVKHGDLDSTLEAPDKALDVHMDAKGNNFSCATCHQTRLHQVAGSRYAPTGKDANPAQMRGDPKAQATATCQSCHGQAPHKVAKLNDHTDKLACQTCHIPAFARGGLATELSWDWSTAGRTKPDGKPVVERNDDGYVTYAGNKGSFTWGENVRPDYVWFNGRVRFTLPTDAIENTGKPVEINHFDGSPTDGKSRIWPVKIFHGKQAYDPVRKTLVVTHLAGEDETAFWKNIKWDAAVKTGMEAAGLPFSGKVDFVATQMTWPITHMVAPKEKAVACRECHASNGRLEKVDGIYMPGRGRDHLAWLDIAGWLLAGASLLVVLAHGLGRIVGAGRKR